MDNITISLESANVILHVIEDIGEADCRARCSDKYFRSHFMILATAPVFTDAIREMRDACKKAEEEQR